MAGIVGSKDSVSAFVGDAEEIRLADRLKNVKSVTFPNAEADEVDVTDFDSTGKETENGDVDYGTLEITQNLVGADQYDKMQERVKSGSTVYFQSFVKNKEGEVVIGLKGKAKVKSVTPEGLERGSVFTLKTVLKISGSTEKVVAEPVA